AKDKEQALAELRARIAGISKTIEADLGERDALAGKLQDTERRTAAIKRQIKALSKQENEQRARIRGSESELAAANKDLARLHVGLGKQLRAAYVIGRQGQTQLLLNQSDVNKVGRVLVYYDYLQRAQTTAISGIHTRVSALEAMAERIQAEIARLAELKVEQQKALDSLNDSRKERAEALTELRQRISNSKNELARLKEDERSIGNLIKNLQKKLTDLPPDATFSNQPFAKLRGKLPWPARGKLISAYGDVKSGGKLTWKGHWISAAEGDPIRAVARGRAVYVGWMHRYGLIVLIEHEGSYYSLYGHAESAAVAVGDDISAGETIAKAGSTGGHDQPGVYFELRKGTNPIDPRSWLAK
ncbi:MAG: peptidoglycan DD-metalloendopeptidase family protein, partial [Pseudomonadota bacterium]|nr:peptidoglycan DD-metalloendopeptidase family protein [Pseudomonadota bacterium]